MRGGGKGKKKHQVSRQVVSSRFMRDARRELAWGIVIGFVSGVAAAWIFAAHTYSTADRHILNAHKTLFLCFYRTCAGKLYTNCV